MIDVYVRNAQLSADEVNALNAAAEGTDIQFYPAEERGLFGETAVSLVIEMAKTIGFSAAYDVMKYAVTKVFGTLTNRESAQSADCNEIEVEICRGNKRTVVKCPASPDNKQKDEIMEQLRAELFPDDDKT